jgi:hypothetical protein
MTLIRALIRLTAALDDDSSRPDDSSAMLGADRRHQIVRMAMPSSTWRTSAFSARFCRARP